MISPGEKKIAFTDRSFLLVQKGMAGATGNIYTGLHEFADMGFLLHFLRSNDLFFDIGANVGSYMVIASAHVGASTFAFEPVPSTFRALEKNIAVNGISSLVKAFNMGVGSQKGTLLFTASFDTVNHVIPGFQREVSKNGIEVNVISIDELVNGNEVPLMIKIDVEGFETEVIRGMPSTLANEKLKAIIIELNGSGGRYGYEETDIHKELRKAGFAPYEYDPFMRKLKVLDTYGHFNTLYLRDLNFINERVLQGDKISLFSEIF